jgi:hypothetical protein
MKWYERRCYEIGNKRHTVYPLYFHEIDCIASRSIRLKRFILKGHKVKQ